MLIHENKKGRINRPLKSNSIKRKQVNTPLEAQPSSLALEFNRLTDNELLVLFVDRQSEAAFNELVTRHSQMVLGVCRSIVSNHACVDDAFQATFLALVRNARRLRNATSFSGWLCRVARHAGIKASKTKRSQECQMIELAGLC